MMNKIVKAINKFVDGDFTINMKRKKKPERIEVTTGLKDSDYTEITSDNLSEGTKVLMPVRTGKKRAGGPPRMF